MSTPCAPSPMSWSEIMDYLFHTEHPVPSTMSWSEIMDHISPKTTTAIGIDLNTRGHEVRKLLFAGFGLRIKNSGYDPEDVLQEVYRGILARNRGKCPFDPAKSSFGHYVHMVCECILNNYHRKESRRREFEQIGMPTPSDAEQVDAAQIAERMLVASSHGQGSESGALHRLSIHLSRKQQTGSTIDPLAFTVVQCLAAGMSRKDIARHVGVSTTRIQVAISNLRQHTCDWQ